MHGPTVTFRSFDVSLESVQEVLSLLVNMSERMRARYRNVFESGSEVD